MPNGVIAFAEQRDGVFKKSAYEAVNQARRIADELGSGVKAVVIGSGVEGIAAELGAYGADTAIAADNEIFEKYSTEGYAKALAEIIQSDDPAVVVIVATAMGKDLAPRLSAKLDVPVIADCVAMTVTNGRIEATRPVYAGKGQITVTSSGDPQVVTLRPNVFTPDEPDSSKSATVEKSSVSVSADDIRAKVVDYKVSSDEIDLTEADIIVSGGRGLKGPENWHLVLDLAKALGAAHGASRAAVDAGWRPHSEQVGQTGKTVTPSLYITVGISGAIQHLAGMRTSKYIVAINKDPEAPIFKYADYGIVADLFDVIPPLIEEVKKMKD